MIYVLKNVFAASEPPRREKVSPVTVAKGEECLDTILVPWI